MNLLFLRIILIYLSLLYKKLRKTYLVFHSLFERNIPKLAISLFKHVYLNYVEVKFQIFIA